MKHLLKFFLIGLILITSAAYFIYLGIFSPYQLTNREILIPRGSSFARINTLLSRQGIIKSPRLFYRYAKFTKALHSLQAGRFSFPQEVSLKQVVEILQKGSNDFIKVTIPEGKNLFEIAHLLESQKVINSAANFIKKALLPPDSSHGISSQATSFEGFLYPDTYHFSQNSSVSEVLYAMTQNFQKQTRKLKNQFMSMKSKLSFFQLVTLASIVEKETGVAFERPIIAGVFYNRLKKNMRLQSDPTTIYGIYERFDGNLRKRDLLEKTDYNTYKIKGLPKGPIANPGQQAIKAVLTPRKHQYLYFVSKNDGTHTFSENYKKHRKAVNYYQKKIRKTLK